MSLSQHHNDNTFFPLDILVSYLVEEIMFANVTTTTYTIGKVLISMFFLAVKLSLYNVIVTIMTLYLIKMVC
jgi:hypothetical protein